MIYNHITNFILYSKLERPPLSTAQPGQTNTGIKSNFSYIQDPPTFSTNEALHRKSPKEVEPSGISRRSFGKYPEFGNTISSYFFIF